jgi:hypothetical protein
MVTVPKWIVAMEYRKYGACKDCGEVRQVYGRQKNRERCRDCWERRGK